MKLRKLFKKLRSRTSFWKSSFLKPPGAKGSPTSSWKLYFQKFRAKKQVLIPIIIVALFLTALIFSNALASLGFFSTDSLNKGLVGHWPLDGAHLNSTTNRVDDISGHGNHGTNNGASLTTDRYGQTNGAMSFNGSSDYIGTSTLPDMNFSNGYTISFWVKLLRYGDPASNCGDKRAVLIGKWVGYYSGFAIETVGAGTNIRAGHYYDTAAAKNVSTNTVSLNTWTHIALRYDTAGNTLRIYQDGAQKGSTSTTGVTLTNPSTGILNIGKDTPHCSSDFSNAVMSDVRIYNRALDTDEIERLYESYKPKMSVGSLNQKLVGHWPLRPDSEKVGSEMMTGDDSDFESTVGNWIAYGGQTVERTTVSPITGTGSMRVVGDGINTVAGTYNSSTGLTGLTVGKKYALIFKYKGSGSGGINARFGAATVYTGWDYGYVTIDQTDSSVRTGRLEFITTQSTLFLSLGYLSTGTHNEFRIDDIHIKPLHTADTTSNSNHGTIYGADIRNHGAEFNSDYVEIGSSSDFTQVQTVSLWAMTDSLADGTNQYLIDMGGNNNWLQIYDNDGTVGTNYIIRGGPSAGGHCDSSSTITASTWYHIVRTFDATTNRIYINGAEKCFNTATGNTPGTIRLGGYGGGGYYLDGQIADILIYDRALSAPEILDLYQGKDVAGAVLDMPLSDKTGFKDISGNANHGTNTGSTIIGEAGYFDGTDDYIDTGNTDSQSSITVAAWVKSNSASGEHVVASKQYSTSWEFGTTGSSALHLNSKQGGTYYSHLYTGGSLTIGEWTFIAWTKDATGGDNKFYQDGSLVGTVNKTGGIDSDGTSIKIGTRNGGALRWSGQISDVHIYSRALSGPEIASLYAKSRSGSSVGITTGSLNKGLIGQWDLKSTSEKVGSELLNNWSFDTGTDWTASNGAILSISGGQADITAVSTSSYIYQNIAPITASINKSYILTIDVATLNDTLQVNFNGVAPLKTITTAGVHQLAFTWDKAYGASVRIYPSRTSGVGNAVLNSLSIKEIKTADSTPNSNHGTIYGATVGTGSTTFDGTNDYVDMGNNASLNNENAMTLSMWIKTSGTTTEGGVVTIGTGVSSAGIAMRIRLGVPAFSARKKDNSGYWDLYTGTNIEDGQWHHVVGTFNTTEMKKYLDGGLQQTGATGQAYLVSAVNAKIATGGHGSGVYFNGSIANVKIYNRVLSLNEIKSLFDKERGQFGI